MPPLDIQTIQALVAALPDWKVDRERGAISRTYQFKDFAEAFGFMAQMAIVSEGMNHHPEWFNVYNRVEVTLTTHDANGLSTLDIDWARKADSAFAQWGRQERP
jgi:4a-hydroxytetrahydrobiopterin dehydratase